MCLLKVLRAAGRSVFRGPLQARSSGASLWGGHDLGGRRCGGSGGRDTLTGGWGLDYFLPLSLPTEKKRQCSKIRCRRKPHSDTDLGTRIKTGENKQI